MPCGAEDEASTDDGLWESPQNQRSRVSSIHIVYHLQSTGQLLLEPL